jgi:hypothetical protein
VDLPAVFDHHMSRTTRRALLGALGSGAAIAVAGCLVPSKEAPSISHPRYPLGAIPWRRRTGELYVGASTIDISPPAGSRFFLAGYGFQRLCREIRDPIFARTLYFDDGVHRVALVVADVVGLLLPTIERVRKLVGNDVEVAVASTHNHQSPDTMGYWGKAILYAVPHQSGVDPRYQRVFERRLAAGVALAAERARPAKLTFARAEIPAGVVRNLRTPGVYDPAVEVIEAVAGDGAPIATFVNFGCHPETLGDRSHRMTADFPGRLRARLDRERNTTTVFANGILGGMITPELDDHAGERERERIMERIGDTIADTALAALKDAAPIRVDRVRYKHAAVELRGDNSLYAYVERVGLVEKRARGPNGGVLSEVGRIDLGPASWALVPGEPTPKVGLRIKAALDNEHTAVIALANDELGYLLDPEEYDDPKFDYEKTVSVGREIAPAIERALAAL